MSDDLHQLNLEMMTRESAGDVDYFDGLLATEFAMRRGDLVTIVGRVAFLDGVTPSATRATEDFEIVAATDTLAIVRSTVAMLKDDVVNRIANIRVFVRTSAADDWKLLSWINEPAGT